MVVGSGIVPFNRSPAMPDPETPDMPAMHAFVRQADGAAFWFGTAATAVAAAGFSWPRSGAFALLFGLIAVGCAAAAIRARRTSGARERQLERLRAREVELVRRNFELTETLSRLCRTEPVRHPVYRCDASGRLIDANDAFFETFGIARDALGSHAAPERVGAPTPEEDDVLLLTAAGPRWFAIEETVLDDAAGHLIEKRITLRDATGRRTREADLARRLAEAEAAQEAQSSVVTAIIHEVRTPVGGMLGLTDLLLETALTPSQESYVQSVRGSAGALLGLIDDLLDHAALKAGRLRVVERPYDLRALVQETCELLGPRAEAKGLSLASFVPRKLPAELLGDPARIRQVLINLVGNAIKFTDRGGVLVCVRTASGCVELCVRDTGRGIARADQDRIFGEFERLGEASPVVGNGLGLSISRKLVEMMEGTLTLQSRRGHGSAFTVALPLRPARPGDVPPPALEGRRFVVACGSSILRKALALALRDEGARVASFARTRRVGTALADGAGADGIVTDLAMARRLEGRLGDHRLVVALAPAERDVLPALLERPNVSYLITPVRRTSLLARLLPAPQEGAAEPAVSDGPGGGRVLLAEDDDVTALVLGAMLKNRGFAVERVRSGEEAIARSARSGPFDLALFDVNMPGVGGIAATAAIRNRESRAGTARLPIVALSAAPRATHRAAATAAGVDMLLQKPVSSQEIAACLAALRPADPENAGSAADMHALSQLVR